MSGHARTASVHIDEELEQIRRYEDFSTTGTTSIAKFDLHKLYSNTLFFYSDWVKDAILERYRQSSVQNFHNDKSWRAWWHLTFESTESWIVVLLVGKSTPRKKVDPTVTNLIIQGAAIGLNSALIAIVTDWLSDIKMGYCSNAWWLNQKFCCWEIEETEGGGCDDWTTWSDFMHLGPDVYIIQYFYYVAWAVSCLGTESKHGN